MVAADLRAAIIVGADPAQRDNGHSEIGRYLLLASGILTRRSSKTVAAGILYWSFASLFDTTSIEITRLGPKAFLV